MEAMAADTTPDEWTDERWTDNLQQVFKVLGVARGMKAPDIADAMGMPRSTFYDKLKRGAFTGIDLRHAARVLDVPVSVFYSPVDDLFTGMLTGSFPSGLVGLPEPAGQGTLLSDDLEPFDFYFRPELTSV